MLSLQSSGFNEDSVKYKRRFSNFNFANEESSKRYKKLLFDNRRSSIATISGVEKRQQNKLKQQDRAPTVADLQEINKNLHSDVSTLAEYSKFYEFCPSTSGLSIAKSKSGSTTGLEEKRPAPCIVIAKDTGFTERVRINISGKIFETYRFMLNRFSDGLLGDEKKRQAFWDDKKKEFYFDHSGECFEGIMQYYQSGILRTPQYTHLRTFIEALEFFQFSQETINQFKRKEALLVEDPPVLPKGKIKRAIWLLFDDPHSSRGAHILAIFSVIIIIMSLVCFCCETLPQYVGQDCESQNRIVNGIVINERRPVFDKEFFLLETICVIWFGIELTVRFCTCPKKLKFILSVMNIIDLVSILPYFVTLIYAVTTMKCPSSKGALLLTLRALRVFRVFKLTRFSKGLQILTRSLQDSKNELTLVTFLVVLGAFLFGMILYTVEADNPHTQVKSVFDGYWWGVATITTVGYGDIIPLTYWGKCLGTACIIMGTVVIALPAPIIVTNFNRYYRNETGRGFEDRDWLKRG